MTALRLAVEADAGAIVEVVNLAYRVEEFFVEGGRTDLADVCGKLATDVFIVAGPAGGPLLGCVHVEVDGPRGHFGMLSVRPDAQRTGLGRALVSAAEEHCRGRGCREMWLEVVNLRNELPPWYRGLGYCEVGTAPFAAPEKQKLPCHFILMSRSLELAAPLEAKP